MTKKAFMRCPIWFLMCIVAVLLLSSCAKKQVVTEEEQVKAPPKEVAKVEEEKPAVKEVKEAEEVKKAEEAKLEKLKELQMTKKREAEEEPPLFHVWHPLATKGAEVGEYAMYTYVLFGRWVDKQRLDVEIWERYESLLDAITLSTPSEIGVEEVEVEKAESNIFYIPAIKPNGKFYFPLDNYNSILAFKYITRLGKMIKAKPHLFKRFTLRPGPFLISTFDPLGEITRGELDLLYADLSDSNPAAMREIVSAYKERVSKEKVIGIQKFKSIRLALLDFILDVDDNLQIVRAEASEWLD